MKTLIINLEGQKTIHFELNEESISKINRLKVINKKYSDLSFIRENEETYLIKKIISIIQYNVNAFSFADLVRGKNFNECGYIAGIDFLKHIN